MMWDQMIHEVFEVSIDDSGRKQLIVAQWQVVGYVDWKFARVNNIIRHLELKLICNLKPIDENFLKALLDEKNFYL